MFESEAGARIAFQHPLQRFQNQRVLLAQCPVHGAPATEYLKWDCKHCSPRRNLCTPREVRWVSLMIHAVPALFASMSVFPCNPDGLQTPRVQSGPGLCASPIGKRQSYSMKPRWLPHFQWCPLSGLPNLRSDDKTCGSWTEPAPNTPTNSPSWKRSATPNDHATWAMINPKIITLLKMAPCWEPSPVTSQSLWEGNTETGHLHSRCPWRANIASN